MRVNREFLMRSRDFDPKKHRVARSMVSEKIDGSRAIWIPCCRGLKPEQVPFLNTDKKSESTASRPITGLFSRYGNVISAPDWFLDRLPDFVMDGELSAGRQRFEITRSVISKHVPVIGEWQAIKYHVFDTPHYAQLFKTGQINNPNYKKFISWDSMKTVFGLSEDGRDSTYRTFDVAYRMMVQRYPDHVISDVCELVHQEYMSLNDTAAMDRIEEKFSEVLSVGGEGLIIRHSNSEWEPYQSHYAYKYKPELDSEGTVIGYTYGKGKHEGRLGSIRLLWNHRGVPVEFDISGLTDTERMLKDGCVAESPGDYTTDVVSDKFPIGSIFTFKYIELTAEGKPKGARFWRKFSV